MCYLTLTKDYTERPVPFVASFSDDGDLLYQWIAYANKGAGVSIGLSTEKLLEYSVDDPTNFLFSFNEIKNDDILLINVEYNILFHIFIDVFRLINHTFM